MFFDTLPPTTPQPAALTQVEDVVVTAGRLPPASTQAAFSAVRLDKAEIGRAVRVDEALRAIPAVSLFRRASSLSANPTTQGLSLRAIAPSGAGRALVTLDGVPVNDPFGGWVIWAQAIPEGLAGIDVVKGAGAGPYGAGALTGTVALRENRADGYVADMSVAQRGGLRAAGSGTTSFDRLSLSVSGLHEKTDGYVPVRGRQAGLADVPMDVTTDAVSGRLDAHISDRDSLSLRAASWEEDRGSGLGGNRANSSGHSLALSAARRSLEGRLGWQLQAWRTHSNLFNSSGAVSADRNTLTPANEQYRTPAKGWGLNGALRQNLSLSAGQLEWELGADLRHSTGRTMELFRYMANAYTRGRQAGGEASVAGLYGDVSLENGPWLVAGGLRQDHWRNEKGFRFEDDLQSGAITLDEQDASGSGNVTSARLGVRRALNDGFSVRTSAYSSFRPATLNELHRPFRVGNDLTEANAALIPETLYGAEAAIGLQRSALTMELSAFWNRIDDAVVNVTLANGPGTFPRAGFVPAGGVLRQRQNAGTIKATGLEFSSRWAMSDAVTVNGALSWTHARMDGSTQAPQLTGLRPAQAPALSTVLGVQWQAAQRLGLMLDARYESSRYDDDLNSRKLDAAWTLDARTEWQLDPHATLWLAADNLLDEDIQTSRTATDVLGFTQPRTVRGGVRLNF